MKRPYRTWINQPSTLQKFHKYHGKVGIVVPSPNDDKFTTIYFTEGDLISTQIPISALALK